MLNYTLGRSDDLITDYTLAIYPMQAIIPEDVGFFSDKLSIQITI